MSRKSGQHTVEGLRKQRRLWFYLWDAQRKGRICPSHRELRRLCGFASTSMVGYHLGALAERGILHITFGVSRAIVVISDYSWVEGD